MANPFSESGNLVGGIAPVVSSSISIIIKVIIAILIIGGLIGFAIWYKKKKQMNIPVTIQISRSNNTLVDEYEAKGGYFTINTKEGGTITVFRLKRKGLPSIDIQPPPSNYLIGLSKKLYLKQKGVDDFEPVHPYGWRYVTLEGGKRIPITELKAINQDATAWVEDYRENAKRRFTITKMWDKYKEVIQIVTFTFLIMIFIYINYEGLKEVALALKEVASSLQSSVSVS